ncbi:MAG: GWxTD domain-containing protein [Bacteroidetes bacterium]|jgi:GWxTD domain-containing protein|nr:GWxTD domain-containing protein [Bacteroidota bacterium]
MRVLKYISVFSVFIGLIFQNNADIFLQKGLELEKQGKPVEALKLWDDAVPNLKYPSASIAAEYLRMAAEHGLTNYYHSASSIYMEAMSGSGETTFLYNRSELEKELLRLEPIMDENEFSALQELLEENDPELFKKIRAFWASLDPTPDTVKNERLIEHWQRIAYSREQFTRKNDPPYGTDDRGLYYVQYGEPDKTEKGRVRITYDTIQTVLNQLTPVLDIDPNTAGGQNFDLMKVANRIQNLFVNPEYEIWIYNSPGTMTENMVLIFGHRSGGSFERLQTLEDFIPESAFSTKVQSSIDKGLPPVPAGMVLQWLYYEYFANKDPYFARFFNEYYSTMQRYIGITNGSNSAPPPDPISMRLTRQQNVLSSYHALERAPDKFSTEEKKMPTIPIDIYQYRLLDESYQPVFVTFMESRPLQAFLTDYTANQEMISMSDSQSAINNEENISWYDLVHGIQLRDENWNILAEHEQSPKLIFYPEEPFISSVFVIPWGPKKINQVFYAKLINNHPGSKPQTKSVFSHSLRGLGKNQIFQPEPLKVESGKMVMSDLILGYQKTELPENKSFFDFVVANDRQIPVNENVVVHFELYELKTDSTGMAHFEVEYEIQPKSGLLGWTRQKREDFNITLNFENFGDRFAESLEIQADGIQPDEYELTWTVWDLLSGRILEEEIEFEVFELPNPNLSTSSVD